MSLAVISASVCRLNAFTNCNDMYNKYTGILKRLKKFKNCLQHLMITHLRSTERHVPYGITPCYLPNITGVHLNSSQPVLDLPTPEGWNAALTLVVLTFTFSSGRPSPANAETIVGPMRNPNKPKGYLNLFVSLAKLKRVHKVIWRISSDVKIAEPIRLWWSVMCKYHAKMVYLSADSHPSKQQSLDSDPTRSKTHNILIVSPTS